MEHISTDGDCMTSVPRLMTMRRCGKLWRFQLIAIKWIKWIVSLVSHITVVMHQEYYVLLI